MIFRNTVLSNAGHICTYVQVHGGPGNSSGHMVLNKIAAEEWYWNGISPMFQRKWFENDC